MLAGLLLLCESGGILKGAGCSGAAQLHERGAVKEREAAANELPTSQGQASKCQLVSLERERSRFVTFDGGNNCTKCFVIRKLEQKSACTQLRTLSGRLLLGYAMDDLGAPAPARDRFGHNRSEQLDVERDALRDDVQLHEWTDWLDISRSQFLLIPGCAFSLPFGAPWDVRCLGQLPSSSGP